MKYYMVEDPYMKESMRVENSFWDRLLSGFTKDKVEYIDIPSDEVIFLVGDESTSVVVHPAYTEEVRKGLQGSNSVDYLLLLQLEDRVRKFIL